MTGRDGILSRFVWACIRRIVPASDHDWLAAIGGEYAHIPTRRERRRFAVSCLVAALAFRADDLLARRLGRAVIALSASGLCVVIGCVAVNALFPNAYANWFIDCNPHALPFDKLQAWQGGAALASALCLSRLVTLPGGAANRLHVRYEAAAGLVLGLSILLSYASPIPDETTRAAALSVFHWLVFGLAGLTTFRLADRWTRLRL